mmetsp:Transcript_8002/g.49427  ORF Transcript_8002/g.49427 Transcript_8002/m.49427 type:complete len:218 (-) Transcript_8002:54-707(-)
MKWTDAKSCASVCNSVGVVTPLVSATLRPPGSRGRVLLQHGFQISIPQGFFVSRYGNGVRRHHPFQRKERVIRFRSLFHQLWRKCSDGLLTQPYLRVHVPLPLPMFQHLFPGVRFCFGRFLLQGFFVHVVLLSGLWKECVEHELQLFAHRFIQFSLRLFLAAVVFSLLRSLGRFGGCRFLREPSHPFVHVSRVLPRSLLHRANAFQRASTPHRARRV